MPPKKIPASTAHGPPSATPLDDHPEPSPGMGEPILAEYNDFATTIRETLRRINELEANADSSLTSLGPQEQLREPRVEPPPEFSGSISEFPNFMAACTLMFTLCPHTYSTDERKVLYVVSRLRGTAMSWAHNIAENPDHQYRRDYPAFKTALSDLYSDRNLRARNEDKLSYLVQTKSAAAYVAEFQSLVEPLELDENSKSLLFHKNLKSGVKDIIANVGRAPTFKLLLDQAISIDQRRHQCELEDKKGSLSKNPSSRPFVPASQPNSSKAGVSNVTEDRNTHFTRSRNRLFLSDSQPRGQKRPAPKGTISQQEKSCHITEGLCLYCGESGHLHVDCPKKPKPESVVTISHYQAPSVAFEQPPSLSENSKSKATTR